MINRIWLFLVFINVAATTHNSLTHTNTICILSRLIFAMANLRRQCDLLGNNKIHVECGKEIVHQRRVCVNKQHDRWPCLARVAKSGQNQLIATHVQNACMCWIQSGRWTAPCAATFTNPSCSFLVLLRTFVFSFIFGHSYMEERSAYVAIRVHTVQFLPIRSSRSVVLPPVSCVLAPPMGSMI